MALTVIIFILILGLLVLVHEFGHFIVAKKSGMGVEEFGFGFPPRLFGLQKVSGKWKVVWGNKKTSAAQNLSSSAAGALLMPAGEDPTIYSINLIPLGGFVRITGENNEQENNPRSFINKPFWPRFFTLVAGVIMNVILAWVLFSVGFVVGLPVAIDSPDQIPAHSTFSDSRVAIVESVKGLPADKAGLRPGDVITKLNNQEINSIDEAQKFITDNAGSEIVFQILRGSQNLQLKVESVKNPKPGEGPTGIALANLGKLSFPWYLAPWEGAKTTVNQLFSIVTGLYGLFTSKIGLSSLGGPVKIAQITGQVAQLGFIHLVQFAAFLSLNLAVLNILPFPALDGGRVFFLIVEKLRGKRNNQKFEQYVNTAGFVFLLLLMALVTINDVIKR